jgi:hypothetical protein
VDFKGVPAHLQEAFFNLAVCQPRASAGKGAEDGFGCQILDLQRAAHKLR